LKEEEELRRYEETIIMEYDRKIEEEKD